MIVKPFRGLRPRHDLAARIPSLPYDVLSSDEARRLAAGDPYTFLHVVKPEIDLDPSVDPHDDRVYAKARENFRGMIERGWLLRDERSTFYLYRLGMGSHVQTGVVGVAAVDDYLGGRVKRHEHTRPDKEDDRTRHAEALSANPGPVFLAYRGDTELEAFVDEHARLEPVVSFTAHDGVAHALWTIDDPQAIARVEQRFAEIPATYIADGHHRAASYARVAVRRRETTPVSAEAPSQHFLAVHFPASQLRILDYNRLVRDLQGLDPGAFVREIADRGFEVSPGFVRRSPDRPGCFGMYLDGRWWLLTARQGAAPVHDPARRLDVAVLAERILGPILGIGDPRTDPRIDFVGGIRGMDELERRVRSGEFRVAFSLHPTRMEDVMAVADAGHVMPPKSTWFEPKLRSGMVVHLLDGSW